MTARQRARGAVAALGVAAAALLAVELGAGARGYGGALDRDPCTTRPERPGRGVDATLQRIVLDGLDGAACELGTSREELVLSFDPQRRAAASWTTDELEDAVRAGLVEAVDRAHERGDIGGVEARLLEELARRAPIDWLVGGGGLLAALLERYQEREHLTLALRQVASPSDRRSAGRSERPEERGRLVGFPRRAEALERRERTTGLLAGDVGARRGETST